MQKFNHNGQEIRFFTTGKDVYLVTSDANKAFGFLGQNTLLDIASVKIDTLIVTDRISIPQDEKLPKGILVLLLSDLVKTIVRSTKPEVQNLADIFVQMAAKSFIVPLTQSPDRKALPAATDHDRVEKLATASRNHDPDKLPQNLELMDGWLTISEMLEALGEDPKDENSLCKDDRFRFWINRHCADIYRAQHGEEPPVVSRKKGKGYCYPQYFDGLVRLYRSNWLEMA